MTLVQIIERIEQIAKLQPAVKTVVPGDVFLLNTIADAKYGVFAWTQGQHTVSMDRGMATYSFTLFYVDRLKNDRSNETEIQSTGIRVLHNILLMLASEMGVGEESFTAFNQRFTDECAGVFCGVRLTVDGDVCDEEYGSDLDSPILVTATDNPFQDSLGRVIQLDDAYVSRYTGEQIDERLSMVTDKVDKVEGKDLSSNDYTDEDKEKLAGLEEQVNADWTAVNGKAMILHKPVIPAEVTDLTVAGWGYTKNSGTYSKPSSGIPSTDLSAEVRNTLDKAESALQSVPDTYRTSTAQDAIDAGKQDKIDIAHKLPYSLVSGTPSIPSSLSEMSDDASHRLVTDTEKSTWNAKSNFSGNYDDLTNKPTIPSEVTEADVAGWGFTKNTGDYSKPANGIPSTDMTQEVQASLDKADSALQSNDNVSELTNDAGYLTLATLPIWDGGMNDGN